jgi:hypothetical protein
MRSKPALLFVGAVVTLMCVLAVLIVRHGAAEQKSRAISAVNELKDIYLHWKRSGRPVDDGLTACLATYRKLYESRPVWPSVFTEVLSVSGLSRGCIFSWTDTNRVPNAMFVVTAGGECYLLSADGWARLMADFESGSPGLLDMACGNYALVRQQDGPANRSQPVGPETNRTSSAAGSRR